MILLSQNMEWNQIYTKNSVKEIMDCLSIIKINSLDHFNDILSSTAAYLCNDINRFLGKHKKTFETQEENFLYYMADFIQFVAINNFKSPIGFEEWIDYHKLDSKQKSEIKLIYQNKKSIELTKKLLHIIYEYLIKKSSYLKKEEFFKLWYKYFPNRNNINNNKTIFSIMVGKIFLVLTGYFIYSAKQKSNNTNG